jgi:hypothetical protein
MMLSLLLAIGAQDAPVRQETRTQTASVSIPDGIAPAVEPYLRCLSRRFSAGLKKNGGADAAEFVVMHSVAREECAGVRAKAAAKAERILARRKSGTAEECGKLAEDTLRDIENMYGSMGFPEPAASSGS